LELKAVILADQLERIGGLSDPPVLPTIPAPQPWNYRNHIQLHLTQDGKLGYVGANARAIIPIRECHLPEDALNAIWPQLEFDPIQELERVSLRAGMEDDFLLILESEDLLAPALSVEDLDLSVVHMSPAGVLVLAGSDFILLEVSDRLFHVSAPSFFQVNTPMAAAMVEHILGNVTLDPSHTVLDVYCGVGLFSAFIAPMVGRLVGIESNPYACDDFVTNLNEFEHVELYQDDAEAVLNNITMEPDLILVDPPRSGLSKPTLQGLLAQGASRIIYISCDPATLARDARHLSAGGYRLAQATPFDLFPQTYHIESISIWEKLPQGD
jgi:23S rRNA (uracil1939-C5)-methyltransferase